MSRSDIHFPPKHEALRDDVHALGALVGEILAEQGGDSLFKLVELDRVASIGRREDVEALTVYWQLGDGESQSAQVIRKPSGRLAFAAGGRVDVNQRAGQVNRVHKVHRVHGVHGVLL